MSEQARFSLRGRNPDVLTCIANLSNDEVFTPPELANQILDTLAEAWAADNNGANLWADRTVIFLDPFTKSGVFLREITSRLNKGLESQFPDLQERVDHILTKQVFGIGITYLTSLLARRSVYCSKFANSKHSVAKAFTTGRGTFGSSAWNTRGSMASACFAERARQRWTAARNWKPTPMHSSTLKTSRLGWPSSLEAICSSTSSLEIRRIS